MAEADTDPCEISQHCHPACICLYSISVTSVFSLLLHTVHTGVHVGTRDALKTVFLQRFPFINFE